MARHFLLVQLYWTVGMLVTLSNCNDNTILSSQYRRFVNQPPKSAKSNKKDKERLKKEEAEQRAAAEELRLQQEQEQQERLARLEFETLERRRLEEEEQVRRNGQLEELEELWSSGMYQLSQGEEDEKRKDKWQRYMLCDGSPDPTIGGEINTYMNLWREKEDSDSDITCVLQDSVLALSLINELEVIMGNTTEAEYTENKQQDYLKTIEELQDLLKAKFDVASQNMLLNASKYADSETMNLQKVMGDVATTLCMWGNLSKNPRIKSYEFSEVNFTFEMPKLLTLSDCAIRVMFAKYDHYSMRSRSFLPRVKSTVALIIEPAEPEVEEGDGEKKEGEEGEHEGSISRAEDVASVNKEEELALPEEVHTALLGADREEENGEGSEEGKEKEEEEEKESVDENPTPEPLQYEDFDGDIDAFDLRANQVLGGVFHFNLFHLPPQPKVVKDWLITQVIEPCELSYMDYKVEPVVVQQTPSAQESKVEVSMEGGEGGEESQKSQKSQEEGENEKVDEPEKKEELQKELPAWKDNDKKDVPEKKESEKTPIGVIMKLPERVYFCEEPQVARWNEELQQWQADGFTDHVYNEVNRTLSFKTNYFGTMALIQDMQINMPFQSWEIRPRSANCTLITVIAAIVEVEIEVKDELCCLRLPNKPELQHLLEQYMPPKQLIKRMREAGQNIFPEPDSSKYVTIQNKSAMVEADVYRQMAITASMMAYSWSKWNGEVKNKKQIIVQGSEHLKDEHLLEEDWAMYMITKKRSIKLNMTEFDTEFADEHAAGSQFHASLHHLTKDMASEKGKERLEDTKFQFVNTVYTLLKAIRPLTYS